MTQLRFGLVFAFLFLLSAATLLGADFYVSPKGSDRNPGTRQKPFATLEHARDAARSAKREGGVTIWLRGGTYTRSDTFTLNAEDGGTATAPVVYRSIPGETARIFGGKTIRRIQKVARLHSPG